MKGLLFIVFFLTRGDLDTYVGVLLTIGDVRRGVNAICARGINCDESTVDEVCVGNLS